jgi:exopolysaccharide production protein ExoZ
MIKKFIALDMNKLSALESLRGIAASMVVIHHYVNWLQGRVEPQSVAWYFQQMTMHYGGAGVALFFVISGYLIPTIITARKQTYVSYMKRRIRRIYPLALIAICLAAAAKFVGHQTLIPDPITGQPVVDFILNLMLVAGVYPVQAFYKVTWTLSYEMMFYSLCPLVLWLFTSARAGPWLRVVLLLLLIPIIHYASAWHSVIAFFLFGMALQAVGHKVKPGSTAARAIDLFALIGAPGLLLLMMISGAGWISLGDTLDQKFFVGLIPQSLCFMSLVAATTFVQGRFAKALTVEKLRIVGAVSYSLYLMHALVISSCVYLVEPHLPEKLGNLSFFALLAVIYLFSLAVAIMSYIFIERPFSLDGKWPWHVVRPKEVGAPVRAI